MTSSLKILHVLPSLHTGGVETATVALTCGLLERGHRVWVMSAGGAWVAPIEARGGVHISYPTGRKAPWHWMQCASHIQQWVHREQIQVIHPHSRAPGWASWMAAQRTKVSLVPTFHALYGHKTPFKRMYNRVMTWGDGVIAPTHFIAQHMQDVYGVHESRIHVVHEGIDVQSFTPINDPEILRQARIELGIPLGAQCVTLPARLTSLKGHAVALQALSLLRDLPSIVLCLMGAPDPHHRYTRRLLTLIQDLHLKEQVIWISSHTPIQRVYAVSDLLINPSEIPEAFGRVVAEAQAMERMVIASHPGGASEVIDDGCTGWLFPRGDAHALSERIRSFFALPLPKRHHGQQLARQWVLKNFHVDRMVEQTLEIYHKALCLKS